MFHPRMAAAVLLALGLAACSDQPSAPTTDAVPIRSRFSSSRTRWFPARSWSR